MGKVDELAICQQMQRDNATSSRERERERERESE